MLVLKILQNKIKETRLEFSQGRVKVLQNMANYQQVRVKLTNTQLNKLKSAAKNKTRKILGLNKSYKLFLTTRQTTKIRNAFAILQLLWLETIYLG